MEKIKRKSRAEELQKKTKKKKKLIRILILLIILIILGVVVGVSLLNQHNKKFNTYEVIKTTELSNTNGSSYLSYKNGILKMSRDGAETYNIEGKALWNVSYNMKDPIGAVCGNYAAIADRGSNSLYIIDGSGTSNQITLKQPIEQIEVAAQGVTAVLTTDGDEDHIYIYGMESQEAIFDIDTVTEKDGFPVEISLSEDGKKLATSYMAIANDSVTSWVTFYNLGKVGEDSLDNIVGSFSFEKIIVPEIKFITNDIVCVYTDNGFHLYKMKEVPEVIKMEEIAGEIKSIFTNNDFLGFIVASQEENGNNKLLLYNLSGKKILEKEISVKYDKVTMTDKLIIFYDNLTSSYFDLNGSFMFTANFTKDVDMIFKTSQSDVLLCVGETSMDKIQLIESKEE